MSGRGGMVTLSIRNNVKLFGRQLPNESICTPTFDVTEFLLITINVHQLARGGGEKTKKKEIVVQLKN